MSVSSWVCVWYATLLFKVIQCSSLPPPSSQHTPFLYLILLFRKQARPAKCDPSRLILFFFFFFNYYLFIYFWLCWVFLSVRGLSPVAASGDHSSSRCAGLSLLRPLPLRSTGSRRAGSVIVAHGPSCSATCGIFPDQGSNPCPLHWQADSQPRAPPGKPTTHS